MLDMGFFDDIATVARQCPKERQTLLFSATYPEGIAKLSQQFMQNAAADHGAGAARRRQDPPALVRGRRTASGCTRSACCCDHFRPVSTLAFCNTKQQCRDLVDVLQAQGFSALALYGELEQRERDQVLVQFANRSCSVLVATDVAARGLDIAQLEAVINVDVTPDPEVHIHRIGRTGRGDAEGLALNLASMDEMGRVGKIEELQGRESRVAPARRTHARAAAGPLQPPMATLQILGGRKEKIRAGDVLGALTGEAGLHARADRQDQRQRVLDLRGGRARHCAAGGRAGSTPAASRARASRCGWWRTANDRPAATRGPGARRGGRAGGRTHRPRPAGAGVCRTRRHRSRGR